MILSIIIPCYNEEKNIPDLYNRCKNYINNSKYELILVDNGSGDKTKLLLKKNFKYFKNTKIISIKKNIGFGNAIKIGIKKSAGNIIGYTHADQETSQDDIYFFIKKFKGDLTKFFIKGKRYGRNKFDVFFTLLMSIAVFFIFFKKLNDIHAQPNIFPKKILKNKLNSLPNDFSIDLAIYLLAIKTNMNILRFKTKFGKRKYGQGNNVIFTSKLINSCKNLISILRLRFE